MIRFWVSKMVRRRVSVGWAVITGETSADPRSYRVDFSRIRAALLLWTGKVSDVLPTNMRDLEAVARLSGVGTTGGELEERYLRVTRLARQVFETRFYGL
mgnify:CR=1 FL=1